MWRTRWKHGFVKSVSYTYIYIPVSWNWLPTLACQSHFTHDTRRKENILPFLEDISQKERFLDIATSWCVLCVMLLQMLLQPSTKKNIIQNMALSWKCLPAVVCRSMPKRKHVRHCFAILWEEDLENTVLPRNTWIKLEEALFALAWGPDVSRRPFLLAFLNSVCESASPQYGRTRLKLPGIKNAPRKKTIEATGLHGCFQEHLKTFTASVQ